MNLNKAIIAGRLTRDPETRNLPSGRPVCSFSLATNRFWTSQDGNKQEETEYHNIVVFGKLADICSKYLTKGQLTIIEGRIQTRSWDDKDGNKKYRTEVVADNMQMGPRPGGQAPEEPSKTPQEAPLSQEEIPVIDAEEPTTPSDKKEEVDVKNIPF